MLYVLGTNCQSQLVTGLHKEIMKNKEASILDFQWGQMKQALNYCRYKCNYSRAYK